MNNLKQYAGLLNNAAPKGEFLAYINEDEAEMLKDNGALGLLTPQGIPSYRRSNYDGSGGGLADSSNDPDRSTNRGDNDGGGSTYQQTQKQIQIRENQRVAAEKARAAETARAIAAEKDRQKRVAEAESAARLRAVAEKKRQDDARLDYITGKYLDVTLDDKQKKEFEQYRTGVRESINPSQKTSNKVVGGLLNTILPGSGMLYNFYLDSTAMGYKMQNPFGNLFGGGGEISLDDVNNLRGGDNGSDSNARSQLVQSITQAINPNLPDSQVNNYFKNIGSKGSGVSPVYMNTYNQAKDQMAKSLNLTPNNQQFGYTANPYPNYSMSMTSANPFFDPLTEQGLI